MLAVYELVYESSINKGWANIMTEMSVQILFNKTCVAIIWTGSVLVLRNSKCLFRYDITKSVGPFFEQVRCWFLEMKVM